ncbi:MAG: hypothetical protein ACFFAT_20030 [Promethearchaeota archaeon]
MEEKKEKSRYWKYLHHFFSGIIIFFMGIISLIFNYYILERDNNLELYTIIGILFILVGIFLMIDDILAETKGISIFNRVKDSIKLKKLGIIFLFFIGLLFLFLLYIRFSL